MSCNWGHLESNTTSLGRIEETPYGHSRGHILCSIDPKIGQNVCPDKISREFEFGSPGVKYKITRSN